MVNSLIILAIVVLPGWISITVNQRYHPRIVDRSAVMLWGILFYHAVVVHIIGILLFTGVIYLLEISSTTDLGLEKVLVDGYADYAKEKPGATFIISGLYVLWILLGSVISGVSDIPSGLTNCLGSLMRKCGIASDPVEEEPIWYRALGIERRQFDNLIVQVSVRMKNGDLYVGQLIDYPILPDSEKAKDFRLGDSIYVPSDPRKAAIRLDFSNHDGGGVLLNTENISSIEYMLHRDD